MESLFNIGDEVICIDSSPDSKGFQLPLVEGRKYVIIGQKMPCCNKNTVRVNVGASNPYGVQCCSKCGKTEHDKHWWFPQERFIKAETNYQLEEEIFESLKGQKILN